ncbi:GyrI-like domain-containing protein [Colwelliaceae bacterium 6441]
MNNYQDRFSLILSFIDKNLDQTISIKSLSEIAYFSEYHFHRQFSTYIGLPVKKYIQNQRLTKSSYQLVFRQELSIGEISTQANFTNAESFARAFKREFNQSPSEFRKQPHSQPWQNQGAINETLQKVKENMFTQTNCSNDINAVSIINFPETKLAVYQHTGSASDLMKSVQHFITWRKANNLPPSRYKTYNLVYNDPAETPDADFKFDICTQTDYDISDNEYNVVNKTIPAGKCAKYRHIGSDQFLEKSLHLLYGQWLPQSGETLRDFPCILERVRMFPDVAESETIIDIYLPLAE